MACFSWHVFPHSQRFAGNGPKHSESHLLIGNLVDRGVVLHALRTVRELEGVVRLIAAQQCAGDGADDGDFRVAPKARLEQSRQFRVSVGNIAALVP